MDRHDLIILGTGVAGVEVAAHAAGAGLDVVAIEQQLVGGECPYWGCIPSKAMARASSVLGEAARVGQLAGKSALEPDWAMLASRVAEVSEHWDDARAASRLEHRGATLLRGRGRILGPAEVGVEGRRIVARKGLVIATGTQPVIPPVDGLADSPYWTNREAVEAATIPNSLIVLGAGAVGLELAQAFRRFGTVVTVVEAADHALPMEEPENSAALDEVLRRDGITLLTGTTAVAVSGSERGFAVDLSNGVHLESERLLVATGRRPDLGRLGVADLGLDPDAASIPTDENLRAGEGVWAVGDVTGHGEFTHVAYYQAQIAAADIVGTGHEPADYTAVPRVTFTDPEVASVGLTEAAARAQDLDVRVGLLPTNSSDRGWLHGPGADLGVIKLVADAAAGVLVGGSSMGPASGEVAAFLAVAIRARIPVDLLMEVIYPYPTFTRGIRGALRRLG